MVEARHNNFWRRFGALVVDAFVVLPFVIFVHKLIQLPGFEPLSISIALILQFVLVYLYHVLLVRKYGQTVGKMATGIVVLNEEENALPSWRATFMRTSVIMISNVAGLVYDIGQVYRGTYFEEHPTLDRADYFLVVFMFAVLVAELIPFMMTDKQRALHDLFGKTVVVKKSMSPFADKETTVRQ